MSYGSLVREDPQAPAARGAHQVPAAAQRLSDVPAGSSYSYEIIIVSYRSRDQIEGLLGGLPTDVPIAIADNACGQDEVHTLLDGRAGRYLDTGGGKGFAKAANMAVRTSQAEYVVFVNPDTRPTIDVFQELIDSLQRDAEVATVSAMTVDAEGRAELGVGGWEPSVPRLVVNALGLHKIWPESGVFARPRVGQPIQLDWVNGACMAVQRERFLTLGGFVEDYFVYNEDMALGAQIRRRGLKQVIRTDVPVLHQAGSSGDGAENMWQLRGAAMSDYIRDHHSRWSSALMRWILWAGNASRIFFHRAARRPVRAGLFAAYCRGITAGRPAGM